VRGCDRDWLRKLYSYARQPDITFFFNVPLKVALSRILDGRTRLKYHEAGLDMNYSADPNESFRIFQKKIFQEYRRMSQEYSFVRIDATEPPDVQQTRVRDIVEAKIDLPRYRWREAPYLEAK
jgi:dTMP kinase